MSFTIWHKFFVLGKENDHLDLWKIFSSKNMKNICCELLIQSNLVRVNFLGKQKKSLMPNCSLSLHCKYLRRKKHDGSIVFFPSRSLAVISTTDRSILWTVVFWPKYNKFFVKVTTICRRRDGESNLGPLQIYYCWT